MSNKTPLVNLAIAGTGFEVIKVVSVDKIVTDAGEAVKILD